LMGAVAGLHPLPYHVVSLAVHAVCVVLVFKLCRRFVPPVPAAVGATVFGAHPALFTALYSVSGIGELLATAFGLASVLLAMERGRRAWWSLPLYAASLMSKESTLLLAVVAWLLARRAARADEPRGGVPLVPLSMLGIAIVYALAFVGRDVFGVRQELAATAPYAVRFDRTLLDNLFTYLGWTARIALPLVTTTVDAVEPAVFGYGVALGVAWVAGLAIRGIRSRGWLEAGVWFGATLAPVLPLAHHTYHYYLDAPLVGAGLGVAVLAGWAATALEAAGGVTLSRGVLAACAIAIGVNSALLVHKIETYPFVDPELRSDPTVDRARIAANAVSDL